MNIESPPKSLKTMQLSKSEIYQINLLKHKTPSERFYLMADLINGQHKAMIAGLKYTHPNANKEELDKCLKEQMMKIYSLKP